MNIREIIGRRQKVTATVAIVGIAILSIVIFFQLKSNSSGQSFVKEAYFTVDDGKTYFADSFLQPYPFDYNGKQAVRACVFKADDGQPFVAYLERYTDAGKQQIAPLLGSDDIGKQNQYVAVRARELEVKRPDSNHWVPAGSAAGQTITSVSGKPGTKIQPEMVYP